MKSKNFSYLFDRRYQLKSQKDYFYYLEFNNPNLTYKKISSIFFRIKKYFNSKNYNFFFIYCFDFIRKWINTNERYTEDYLIKLEFLLKKLELINSLNSMEEEYLNHFKSIVFAKKRNLKELIVDFPLLEINKKNSSEKEKAYYYFSNAKIFLDNSINVDMILANCNIYITNYRIVFSNHIDYLSFFINKINSYKLGHNSFEFVYNNQKYLIQVDDKYEFFVSYERIINLIN